MAKKTVENEQLMGDARAAINDNFTELYDVVNPGGDITTTGKIFYNNKFDTLADLPDAVTYHGMFAHVHETGKAYYAHAGVWKQLADADDVTTSNGGPSIVTGNYTGNGFAQQSIELGFRPAVVHVKCTSAPYYGEMTQIDPITEL